MPNYTHYKKLLTTPSGVYPFLSGMLILLVGMFLDIRMNTILLILGASLAYVGADLLGFRHVLNKNNELPLGGEAQEISTAAYRVLQHTFFVFVLVLIYLVKGAEPTVRIVLLWISGLYDLGYYIFGDYRLPSDRKWPWLGWIFPLGWLSKIFKYEITTTILGINIILVNIITLILFLFFL